LKNNADWTLNVINPLSAMDTYMRLAKVYLCELWTHICICQSFRSYTAVTIINV